MFFYEMISWEGRVFFGMAMKTWVAGWRLVGFLAFSLL